MNSEDKSVYIEFGKRLKDLRLSRGYTQSELASIIGLSQTAIVQYEAGSRKVPLKILKVFSSFYGLTLDELIESDVTYHSHGSDERTQHMSKYEIATEMGFTKDEIKILESGTKQIPKHFFEKFANYFGVDINSLTALNLEAEREHAVITTDNVLTERYRKWQSEVGYDHFTDEEIDQLIDYAKYIVSKRNR